MERQRSFSFKPTRFLVFSFTISSSLIFLTFFTIWVTKSTPSVPQETHFPSVAIQTMTGFSRNLSVNALKDSILEGAHLSKPENASGFSGASLTGDLQKKKNESQVAEHEGGAGGGLNGNFTTVEKSAPAILFLKIESTEEQNAELNRTGELNAGLKKIQISSDGVVEKKRVRGCDFTRGRWVYDESYPLYTNVSCPLIDEGFNCLGNGRKDKDYMKWRWQPQDCDIPRNVRAWGLATYHI